MNLLLLKGLVLQVTQPLAHGLFVLQNVGYLDSGRKRRQMGP